MPSPTIKTRRGCIDKDLAAAQQRQDKYKDQLMAVKTNDEFRAMQHQIEAVGAEVGQHEERVLVNMMEADEINAAIKKAEAALKAAQSKVAAERAAIEQDAKPHQATVAECAAARARLVRGDGQQGRGRDLRAHRQGPRHRRGARRRRALHDLPGAPAAGGLRRRPQERSLVQCDSCNRILYFVPPSLSAPRGTGGTGTASPAPVITAYFDGGARGNPGPAGYGVYIVDDDGTVLAELSGALGIATNNVAEYHGLIAALQWAADHGVTAITVKGDSLLLIEQMRGNYKVKNEGLKPLYHRRAMLVMQIGNVTLRARPPRTEQGRRSAVERRHGRERQVILDPCEKLKNSLRTSVDGARSIYREPAHETQSSSLVPLTPRSANSRGVLFE